MRREKFIYNLDEIPLFVDVNFLCDIFKLKPDTIRKSLRIGRIKGVKVGDKDWRIPKTEIERIYKMEEVTT